MMRFGAGSFAYLDPRMQHYAVASGETVVQIHGESPVSSYGLTRAERSQHDSRFLAVEPPVFPVV